MPYADLEIRILNREPAGYPVELTLDSEQQFERGYLDPAFLPWIPSADPRADGERLFAWFCAHEKVKNAWVEVRGQHPQRRLRLRISACRIAAAGLFDDKLSYDSRRVSIRCWQTCED